MREESRLKTQFNTEVRKQLMDELKLGNVMEVPTFEKIVINAGLGEAISDPSVLDVVEQEMTAISGQKPIRTMSKGAISTFKIRKGDVIGMKVTLRGNRMWEFLDKLINVTFPRTKDFRGLPIDAFDGQGNYTVGIEEQTVFPEIDPNEIKKLRGMEITIVTSTKDDERARALLSKFGFPFAKDGKKV
ncbi:MAG: 50S ribosomal protein L5 [Candidatus Dojkabacteria bacterium]|nr:50S ribosomal protein L5 [Candidatus Dojkabacteria bacterium]